MNFIGSFRRSIRSGIIEFLSLFANSIVVLTAASLMTGSSDFTKALRAFRVALIIEVEHWSWLKYYVKRNRFCSNTTVWTGKCNIMKPSMNIKIRFLQPLRNKTLWKKIGLSKNVGFRKITIYDIGAQGNFLVHRCHRAPKSNSYQRTKAWKLSSLYQLRRNANINI